MDFASIKRVYFLGIGGIGMSALARYFKSMDVDIHGYDKTSTLLTTQLISEWMKIHFDENTDLIPENIDFVVYTPAIPSNHVELIFFQNNNFNLLKRSQVLGIIAKNSKAIGVAGTHGKTTISTMVAHLLKQSSVDCNAFLGGISKNYNSNLLLSQNSKYVVIEADEFDRSFLQLSPFIASISSIDADHLDIYGDKKQLVKSFEDYISQIQKGGKLVIKKGLKLSISGDLEYYTYSLNEKSDFFAENIRIEDGYYTFDCIHPFGKIEDIQLGYPGLHNIENSIVAIAIALLTGVKDDEIIKAMKSFQGVCRRFDIRINNGKMIYIDDYAHHPEELKACISSVRDLFKNKKITGIFKPHLYSRTRDFADDFAKSLEMLDTVILMDIYPARELPISGVTSQMLLDKINLTEKFLFQKSEILQFLKDKSPEVLLTLGAGDIDQMVEPIEQIFR
jgi:UDP-N-acetylmuramate--alanine ligase